MRSLVNSLITPFLSEADIPESNKAIGVFGGGFQPPTRGHFEVVRKALEMYPQLNELNIYVGTGGGRSDITQEQSIAIWNIYKDYLPSKVNIIPSSNPISSIYSYAKDEPDAQIKWFLGSREDKPEDFADFEKRTKSALGKTNIEPINIVTTGGVSGTKARAVLDNKEEFFKYLPNIEDTDKEKIYSILRPNPINEIVPEPEIDDIDNYADDVLDPIDIDIPPHFVDRVNDKRNNPPIETDELYDFFDKLSDEKDELEDLLDQGEVVAVDSDTNINIPLTKDNRKSKLRNKVVAVAKTIMRKQNFATSNTKLVFEKIQGDSIVCDNCGWTWKIKDGGSDLYICHKCGHDNTPKESNDFFEPLQDIDLNTSSDSSRVNYYKDHIKNVVPSDFKVDKHKDKIIVSNITKKGLEHNTEFRDKLISLTLSMMDNGLNLEPLPDIIFIEDDKKNADNILGRTAYYDPNTSCITLYTHSRHPKDILRSYAHEMIHHMQNLEGRIQGIKGHNINEDEYLQELELEAYSKGNMCFRSWENGLNESKFQTEYKQYAVNELFEKDLPNIKQISPNEYKVGNGDDIEALYYFRLEIPEKKAWSVHWAFTDNNKNTSPEAWKQVTASSFKVLKNFLDYHNPKSLHISGNTNTKTKIYKTYAEKLENMFSDRYKVDNSDEDKIVMRSIEEVMQSSIKKRMETLNETYDQALNYWQNGNINSNSKSESWSAIKQKVKREVLQSLYNI